ncbi:MAG: SUF system NifU family Fe-S cluster assembly protein [Dehalococcoidia bacterium]|nr:SUF system NifU family Fe-S cluster assembly protein [Dehalococcoidia bacterium]
MAIAEPQFDDLYREIILDHAKKPRNRGELPDATQRAEGLNPVCGDEIAIDLRVDGGQIADIRFRGQGCSISQSSVSMLSEQVKGRSTADAHAISGQFKAMLTESVAPGPDLGDLEALEGVAKFPVRVKCALLGVKVLEDALAQAGSPAKE